MPWLIANLLGAGAWLKEAARYLLAHPSTLAAIVFAILWRVEAHESATKGRALVQCQAAHKAAQTAHDQAETHYRQEADHAERFHTMVADSGPVLVAAYSSVRRVQPAPADAPAKGDGPAVPLDAPAVPAVAVPESVLNTCDADYSYSLAAHMWAKQFEATQ